MNKTSQNGPLPRRTGSPGALLPRTFKDLSRLVRRHIDPDVREILVDLEDRVRLLGWRRVRRNGGPKLETFYERATEVFNEISSAVHEVTLTDAPLNRLVGRWDFRFPVEDLVLDRLHSRHLGKRIVLVDGDRAFVRDGLGVRLEPAAIYAPPAFAVSAPEPVARVTGRVGPVQPSLGLFDALPRRSSGMDSPTLPN